MPSYNYRSRQRPTTYGGRSNNSNRYGSPKRRGAQHIDSSRFIKAAKPIEEDVYVPTHKFNDFNISELLKKNITTKGYVVPSPIQDQTIPQALEGKDIIGIANTGTGKTAAFALPLLDKIIKDHKNRALIIAPTRELAQQIEDECRSIGKGSGLLSSLLIGGTAMGPQLRDLRDNPNIVIGTPGRIKDHIERGTLRLEAFNLIVLDEVDRMLDMGFIDDVREILSKLSPERQSMFFSATLDTKVKNLIFSFAKEPVIIELKTSQASENVNQDIVKYTSNDDKLDKLHDILIREDVEKSIIFADTQRSTERLREVLRDRGFKVDAIHGGKSQSQRQRALSRFKQNDIKVLVATDVAARGIDVVDVTHVINYVQPQTYDDYIHRIGRAGRAGRTGYALTFVTR
jgi:ATP-dependent RNA helicase RhlE